MMEWIVAFSLFILLQFAIWKLPFFKIERLPTWTANVLFFAKWISGIALFFIYTIYYTNRGAADIFKFYDDGLVLKSIIKNNPKEGFDLLFGQHEEETKTAASMMCNWRRPFSKTMLNENRLLIRINCLLAFVFNGFYQLHNLFFCLLSFLGSWWLLKVVVPFLSTKNARILLAVLFFPSVMLWTSGLLKEGFLLFSVGGVLWVLLNQKTQLKQVLALLFFFFLLSYTRTIVAGIFVIGTVSFLISQKLTKNRWIAFTHASWYALVLVIVILLPKYDELYDYFKVIAKKQRYIYEEAVIQGANSVVELPRITKDPSSFLSTIPLGFFYGLAQPMPFQAKGNKLILINGIENILLHALFVYLFIGIRKPSMDRAALFWLLLICSVVYLSFIGLLVPVLGNMVRYKALVVPLLASSLLLIQKENRLGLFS